MPTIILITGSNGLLGQKLVNLYCRYEGFKIIAVSKGVDRNLTSKEYSYYNCDITNEEQLKSILILEKPDCIINTAAMTNVDVCEREKDLCYLINVEVVKTLINYSKENEAHLVHISTDFIFDGKAGPYKEDDLPNPINYYGQSKLNSEKLILESGIQHTVLRTILVYGIVDNMNKGNIVLFVKESLENEKEITIVDDQFRMPTFVDDLAQACFSSVENKVYGVYNVSSNELLSIYDMAVQISDTFHLDTSFIKRIPTSKLNQQAKRPAITGFNLEKSKVYLNFPIASFKNRLQVFKDQLINFDKPD